MNEVSNYWEHIANTEPNYGVLTSDDYLTKNFKDHETEFYESGNSEVKYICEYLKKIGEDIDNFKEYNFIEIGTGTGRIAYNMITNCNNLYCVDVSNKYLKICAQKLLDSDYNNFSLVNYSNFYKIQYVNIKLIYSWITLQHNPPDEIKKMVTHVCNILDKGGYAFLHIPYLKKKDSCLDYISDQADSYKDNTKYDKYKMLMSIVPKLTIVNIIRNNNCKIIEIVDVTGPDGFGHCGENFKDAYYIFQKN